MTKELQRPMTLGNRTIYEVALDKEGDLKRVCPQKWIKTPERLLQIEKIDHIREVPTDDGGGTLFVHVNGEGLYEPKLPFEEACKLLGYQD